ncbi:MAG: 4'-phosphopantetheinyl transferase superfamily protein [Elusimicrobiota bacterium]|jgi:4'-phosphopantetheinyl transferase|nr:4'-phosphopantetheinyl transferase superfamily protein [Elusimicrobiota bacterium]
MIYFTKIINNNLLKNYIINYKKIKFKNFEFCAQKILSRLLIKKCICNNFDLKYKDIIFEKYFTGKPFIKNYSYIYYNMSHTNSAIICSLNNSPVGIDIEKIRNLNNLIFDKYFYDREKKYVMKSGGLKNKNKKFFEIFTKKEAYIKYFGEWDFLDFSHVNIFKINKNIKFLNFEICDFSVSVCFKNKDFNKNIFNISQKKLIEFGVNNA